VTLLMRGSQLCLTEQPLLKHKLPSLHMPATRSETPEWGAPRTPHLERNSGSRRGKQGTVRTHGDPPHIIFSTDFCDELMRLVPSKPTANLLHLLPWSAISIMCSHAAPTSLLFNDGIPILCARAQHWPR